MFKNLTIEQKNILNSLEIGAEFAADIAHACVTVYLLSENPKYLFVAKQAFSTTQFLGNRPNQSGREIRLTEEPLIFRAIQRNIIVTGKRELTLGVFADIRIFPLKDSRGKCFAAVAFDAKDPDPIFIMTAMKFLRHTGMQIAQNPYYRRLSPSDGLMVVDQNKIIVAANQTAQHIFQVLGISDIVGKRTNSLQINWPLVSMVLQTGIAEGKELEIQNLLLSLRIVPVTNTKDSNAAIIILRDITELKKKDTELMVKGFVIKEIHHRVKNNLQAITGLLRLQARIAQSAETKNVLRECINRVNSIAVVHEYLSQQESGKIDLKAVTQGVYEALIAGVADPNLQLSVIFDVEQIFLDSEKATSIALILNELLQNCLKHGFVGRSNGKITISFLQENNKYCLKIADDGNGLPQMFTIEEKGHLGMKIIKTIVEADLHGTFSISSNNDGTETVIIIPIVEEE